MRLCHTRVIDHLGNRLIDEGSVRAGARQHLCSLGCVARFLWAPGMAHGAWGAAGR
jgi:hypothetical protein